MNDVRNGFLTVTVITGTEAALSAIPIRHYVASPERWERISLPPSRARTADKRYVCEMEGLVVLGRHCGRCVDVGFPDVLRQLYQFFQIPSFGGSRTPPRGRQKSWRTVLLSGPAATGKHSLARALSSGIRVCSVSYVYVPELLRKPKHNLEVAVRSIFDASAAVVPVVVILDRVDEICNAAAVDASKVVSDCIQEVLDDSDVVARRYVVGVTNAPWLLTSDVQVLFQRRVYVPLPDHTCSATITEHLLSGSDGYASSLSLGDIADATEGFTSTELAMCLRSPFYHIDSREKLNQRFVDLVKVSGIEPARCCSCVGEVQPDEETTPPLSSVSEVGPASPSTTPLFPVDVELQKAIAAMTKVLAQNPRPRPPRCGAAVRTYSRSSVRNCTIC
ncbi:vacuolar protein sorting-associated protein 4B-like [Rhipicephalus sanguineus]|uniref:vacuolar protein sorting-associated protein 4B-like n=1 Tax=Rhipicephalus sanguineus TaxID=34632 RepID=UPI0018935A89|nr:vacuolar protein sorting-associated protein 4B-like [Rhipicephalus sanguineus]